MLGRDQKQVFEATSPRWTQKPRLPAGAGICGGSSAAARPPEPPCCSPGSEVPSQCLRRRGQPGTRLQRGQPGTRAGSEVPCAPRCAQRRRPKNKLSPKGRRGGRVLAACAKPAGDQRGLVFSSFKRVISTLPGPFIVCFSCFLLPLKCEHCFKQSCRTFIYKHTQS